MSRRVRRHAELCGLLLLLACGTLLAAPERSHGAEGKYGEYEVKAAFLCKLASFVEWPEESFPEEDTPIVMGVLGDDPFRATLDRAVAGRQAQGRDLQVKRAPEAADLKGCHIVFVSRSEELRLRETLKQFEGLPVLTVGETDEFTQCGGVLRLWREQNKIRFEVNVATANKARLKISSQVLKLARVVKDEAPGPAPQPADPGEGAEETRREDPPR